MDEHLDIIRHWDAAALDLIEYIRPLWRWESLFKTRKDITGLYVEMITGGLSDHEYIVRALKDNRIFWALHWQSSHRGGKHIFWIRDEARAKRDIEVPLPPDTNSAFDIQPIGTELSPQMK